MDIQFVALCICLGTLLFFLAAFGIFGLYWHFYRDILTENDEQVDCDLSAVTTNICTEDDAKLDKMKTFENEENIIEMNEMPTTSSTTVFESATLSSSFIRREISVRFADSKKHCFIPTKSGPRKSGYLDGARLPKKPRKQNVVEESSALCGTVCYRKCKDLHRDFTSWEEWKVKNALASDDDEGQEPDKDCFNKGKARRQLTEYNLPVFPKIGDCTVVLEGGTDQVGTDQAG